MNDRLTAMILLLTPLALAACVGASSSSKSEPGASASHGSEQTPLPASEDASDPFSALLDLQPSFEEAPHPPERFHATPPKPYDLMDLQGTRTGGHLPPAIVELRQAGRAPRVESIPELVGACEVVERSSEGVIKSVNHTEWSDGLPVATWLDDDADGVVDAEVHYTHDSEKRLIRVVLEHLEYPASCPWRVETQEHGYDANGALVLVDFRSRQRGDERRIDEVWIYDESSRPLAIYSYDEARIYSHVELFQWKGGTLMRADSFARDGEWRHSFVAAEKGAWLRLDYFRVIHVSASKREGVEAAGVTLLEFKGSELASRMSYSRLGDGELELVSDLRNDHHRRVETRYTDGVLTYSKAIDADGGGVTQLRQKDGKLGVIWTQTWSEDRRVLTESHSTGRETVFTLDCEPFKPSTKRKRIETCPKEGEPTLGPSDGDQ